MSKFGNRLREMRMKQDLTQKQLGQLFQLSESAIGMYERNQREPSLDLVTRFANYFRVSTGYLLGQDPSDQVREPLPHYPPSLKDHFQFQGRVEPLSKEESSYLFDALNQYRAKNKRRSSE